MAVVLLIANPNLVKEVRDHLDSQVSNFSHLKEARGVDLVATIHQMASSRCQTYSRIQEAACKLRENLTWSNHLFNSRNSRLSKAGRVAAIRDQRSQAIKLISQNNHQSKKFRR